MGFRKKTGKGRLDKYYHLAKDQGYRARSAFKLIQLNKKYDFLSSSRCLIDLCAAPGGWLQVAAKYMPVESLIVGVDLSPIKPIPKCITFQEDITSPKCRAHLREHLKTWKADVVLHDGAPNVGTAWAQDAFSQAELTLESLKLAVEFLNKGGIFVTKVFRSKDYNNLLWVFKQLFRKVEATKPPSSRNVSAEIFVVCQDFLAPKKIDPKYLDIKYVFKDLDADLESGKVAHSVNIFKSDKKKTRHRDGYADGATILHNTKDIMEFVESEDPVTVLSSTNRFIFDSDKAKELLKLPPTDPEFQELVKDLKVLGKKEFRNLLKWRRDILEILKPQPKAASKDDVKLEIVQESLEDELVRLADEEKSKLRKTKRKVLEKRQKELIRLQLKMAAPMDIGLEQSNAVSPFIVANGKDNDSITQGDMDEDIYISDSEDGRVRYGSEEESDSGDDSEREVRRLEAELDNMYNDFKEKRLTKKQQLKAQQAKYEDWHGFGNDKKSDESESDDQTVLQPAESDFSEDDVPTSTEGLSAKAALFFDQPIFKNMQASSSQTQEKPKKKRKVEVNSESVSEGDIENDVIVSSDAESEPEDPLAAENEEKSKALDLLTPEAMTLAMKLVNREITKTDLISATFNRYAFDDSNDLPEWFRDEEKEHNKPFLPVTKEAVRAIREQQKQLDARPIKKVAEAKARKKFKAAQKLAKMQKKASTIAESSDMTEKEKAKTIEKMVSRAKGNKKPERQIQLVVAKGGNRGIAGRPKGVKGRYKMVDPRMKKELRATKRQAKKSKKKRH